MARTGRPPTDTGTLKARGSWRAKAREKAERAAAAPKPKRARGRWRDLTPAEVAALVREIPGYDPFASAEGYRLNADRANQALAFFPEQLVHIEGALAGQPFRLERWQQAVVANLHGWEQWSPKWKRWVRRYREALLYVPRKNGKTPIVAGQGLYVLLDEDEPGQQDYLAASTREQAGKLFRYAKGMVHANPTLAGKCRVYGGTAQAGQAKSIVKLPEETSFLQVIAADADAQHGGTSHLVIVEELHTQPDRELVDALATSMASENRAEPLTLYVTTADFQRESICNEKYDYACKVRDGVVDDPRFLPVVYEAKPADDWTSPDTWRRANPNLGVSVSLDYLERECRKAKETPSYENTFKRLHLNLRTEQDVRWLPLELWDKGGGAVPVESLADRACYAAIDFGWRDDFAARGLVFPPLPDGDGVWDLLVRFWLPADGARDKRRPPLADFLAAGLVDLTSGNATDVEAIYADLRECRERYAVRQVALDPANARKQGQDLMADGFEVFEFIQSKRSYNEPCRFLEALLKDGKLRHGGHKVLRWMAANAAAELDGLGQMMPKKKRSSEKIDGICAATMALGRAMLRKAPDEWYTPGCLLDRA